MNTIRYRPQAAYWRKAIYRENNPELLRALALELVAELELHKREFRAAGMWPPKGCWAPGEREEKEGGCSDGSAAGIS